MKNFWKNIAINTWAAKVPSGWIIKSLDTKNELPEETEENKGNVVGEKIPIAMSNSMISIDDPQHGWNFNNFKWLYVARDTWRAKVIGGWIVKCVDSRNLNYIDFEQINISSSMVFVSDPIHSWKFTKRKTDNEIQEDVEEVE